MLKVTDLVQVVDRTRVQHKWRGYIVRVEQTDGGTLYTVQFSGSHGKFTAKQLQPVARGR